MPFGFCGNMKSYVAKLGVVSDGEVITVSATDGYTVTSTLSQSTAFAANPVRGATAGVWSVQMKDSCRKVLDVDIKSVLPSASYLSVQLLTTTTGSNGQLKLNWVFHNAGTPADLPEAAGSQFLVYVVYGESA